MEYVLRRGYTYTSGLYESDKRRTFDLNRLTSTVVQR